MKSHTSIKFVGLALLCITLVGIGCASGTEKVIKDGVSIPVPSDKKSIEIGGGFRMNISKEWSVDEDGSGIMYLNTCPNTDNDGSLFCLIRLLVTSQGSGPEALLEFSNKDREFSWFCPAGQYGQCSTDQEKLAQVEKKDGYWTASSVGMVENAAVAFEHKGRFIVVFGANNPQELYQTFSSLIE